MAARFDDNDKSNQLSYRSVLHDQDNEPEMYALTIKASFNMPWPIHAEPRLESGASQSEAVHYSGEPSAFDHPRRPPPSKCAASEIFPRRTPASGRRAFSALLVQAHGSTQT